jgi:hypothetical protein
MDPMLNSDLVTTWLAASLVRHLLLQTRLEFVGFFAFFLQYIQTAAIPQDGIYKGAIWGNSRAKGAI